MIRSLKALGVALAAAATLAVAAAPAPATTYHTATDYLYWCPGRTVPDPWPRDLDLDGTYYWRATVAHWARDDAAWTSRTVTLHGRYRWYDDLDPIFGCMYKHTSTIKNLATGGRVTLWHDIYNVWGGDGWYDWGSTLDNIRAL